MWDAQVAALGPRWRVITPDLQGFGQSEAPDDPSTYSMESYADSVAALLDDLGVGQAVVGGLSMGGYIALAFVRRHRSRVAGLVLADTRAGADSAEVAERRVTQQRQIAESGTAEVIETSVTNLLSDYTHENRPEVVTQARSLMDNPPAGFIGALGAMLRRSDATEELAGIDVAALVIVGEHDKPSPPAVAEEMVARLPQARLAVIETAGHLSNLEAPDEFNRALISFLEELSVAD